jgi:hypothetical protein
MGWKWLVGWFGGGRLVALAAVLFSNTFLCGFARAVRFCSPKLSPPITDHHSENIYFTL